MIHRRPFLLTLLAAAVGASAATLPPDRRPVHLTDDALLQRLPRHVGGQAVLEVPPFSQLRPGDRFLLDGQMTTVQAVGQDPHTGIWGADLVWAT